MKLLWTVVVLCVVSSWSHVHGGDTFQAASALPSQLGQSNGNVQLADGQGNTWQFEYQGTLESRTINNMHRIRMDNNWSFSPQNHPQITPDGQEGVATATYNSIQIIRRTRAMTNLGIIRIVDVFINTGSAPITTVVENQSDINWNPFQIYNDQAQLITNGLGKKDAIITLPVSANYIPHGFKDVLMFVCSPNSRNKPTVTNQGRSLVISWTLKIPPGKAVALVHAVTEGPGGTAMDVKAVKKAFSGVRSRHFLGDLSKELRRVIINWGSLGTSDAPDLAGSIPPELIEARGADVDLLALGAGTRLRGEATGNDVPVTVEGKSHVIPWQEIIALRGGTKPALFLRTGEVLTDVDKESSCIFTLATGQQVPITLQRVGWLLRRPRGEETLPPGDVMIQLEDQQRLVGKPAGSRLLCSTLWGQLNLRLEDIASLSPQSEGGYRIVLRDGSRFSGLLTDGTLSIDTYFTGRRTIAMNRITGVIGGNISSEESDDVAASMPHALLVGDQQFMGIIDVPELHVRLLENRLPVPPQQIRLLSNQSDGDALGIDRILPPFRFELWSGDVVEGQLEENALPLRTIGGTLLIPPADFMEVHVPTPVIAPATRARIAELVAQLGDRDWKRRESAVKALVQLGEVVRQPAEETLQTTKDVETRARLEQVLRELK